MLCAVVATAVGPQRHETERDHDPAGPAQQRDLDGPRSEDQLYGGECDEQQAPAPEDARRTAHVVTS